MGLTEGNIFQGELSLEQLFFNRPVPGLARYRTPVEGLWLAARPRTRAAASWEHRAGSRRSKCSGPIDRSDAGPGCACRVAPDDGSGQARQPFDAIVVGGGHNGLVCAALLAGAGMRTLLLEARDTLGGPAETRELWPGVRVPAGAHSVGRFSPAVARRLDLKAHGLSLVSPAVRVFAPESGLTLWADPARTLPELRDRFGAAEADAYERFDGQLRDLGRIVGELGELSPPDVKRASRVRRDGRPSTGQPRPRVWPAHLPGAVPDRPGAGRGCRDRCVRPPSRCARRLPGAASATAAPACDPRERR